MNRVSGEESVYFRQSCPLGRTHYRSWFDAVNTIFGYVMLIAVTF